MPDEIKFRFDETFLSFIDHNLTYFHPSGMPDEHILLFIEHKFNLMTLYFIDEFCYQRPTIKKKVYLTFDTNLKKNI